MPKRKRKTDIELANTHGIENLKRLAEKRGHSIGWALAIQAYRDKKKQWR